ncbi:hypothetical protein D3C87_1305570 [compost metagenome]
MAASSLKTSACSCDAMVSKVFLLSPISPWKLAASRISLMAKFLITCSAWFISKVKFLARVLANERLPHIEKE